MFKEEAGWGFIKPDDGGADVFVHAVAIMSSARPQRGQRVAYELGTNVRTGRVQAEKVRLL